MCGLSGSLREDTNRVMDWVEVEIPFTNEGNLQ